MNIQSFLHEKVWFGYWVSGVRLWKTRTFPQSPQVFPQAYFAVFCGNYPLSVDIILSPGFDFFPTFLHVKKHTTAPPESKKKDLTRFFMSGTWQAAAIPIQTSAPRSSAVPPAPPPWEFGPKCAGRSALSMSPTAVPCSPVRSHCPPTQPK